MTIAACHVSPEGVVLGADSATTLTSDHQGTCHLDYAQKLFEVGPEGSSVGLVTWGLGQVGQESHRTVAAEVGFKHEANPYESMSAMASGLATAFWERYIAAYGDYVELSKTLAAKVTAGDATEAEQENLDRMFGILSGGYCLAGRVEEHGPVEAFTVMWAPHYTSPRVERVPDESPVFWGVSAIMERLIFGFDSPIISAILESGNWSGTEDELLEIITGNQLISPRLLPIREAIDWVHTVIHTTIRTTKFANWPHWCGGPVEIAVITTDRPFRWVRHKRLDAAIITSEEARR
jgi:hypothetical protein